MIEEDLMDDCTHPWGNMPSYYSGSLDCYDEAVVYLQSKEDLDLLSKTLDVDLSTTRSTWYPKEKAKRIDDRWISDIVMPHKYPLYIISKGRADKFLTGKIFDKLGLTYTVVVEEQEYEQYRKNIPEQNTILILDPQYKIDYETFDPEGDKKGVGKGSGPARNFVWDHSNSLGVKRHWLFDDNIEDFYRFHYDKRIRLRTMNFLRIMEDFVDRYKNVPLAGFNYIYFVVPHSKYPPYHKNTKVYSAMLIENASNYKWRCRYNEDVDFTLRVLKDRNCTILFNNFICGKITTQVMKGGNTAEFYSSEGTMGKSAVLKKLHPDITKVVEKYGRVHHHVDYSRYRNNIFIPVDDTKYEGINEFGMKLIDITDKPEYNIYK